MSINDSNGQDSIDARTERALTECMSVLPDGGDIYTVVGVNDGRLDECDCLPTFEDLPCFACYQAGFMDPK
jgi:hypothetical protein